MKRILLFALILTTVPGLFAQTEAELAAAKPAVIKGKIYAVVVGVSDYALDQLDLRFCHDDAQDFYDFLVSKEGGYTPESNIAFLTNSDATRDNILSAMNRIYAKCGPNDEAVFFFSGHGDDGLFVPHDYTGTSNALYHRSVKAAFANCNATRKIVLADACLSGSIRAGSAEETLPEGAQVEQQIAVFMSSRKTEFSLELGSLRQSVFTFYAVKGLEGAADLNRDNKVQIDELYKYVKVNVEKDTKGKQHPVLFGKFPMDMILVDKND